MSLPLSLFCFLVFSPFPILHLSLLPYSSSLFVSCRLFLPFRLLILFFSRASIFPSPPSKRSIYPFLIFFLLLPLLLILHHLHFLFSLDLRYFSSFEQLFRLFLILLWFFLFSTSSSSFSSSSFFFFVFVLFYYFHFIIIIIPLLFFFSFSRFRSFSLFEISLIFFSFLMPPVFILNLLSLSFSFSPSLHFPFFLLSLPFCSYPIFPHVVPPFLIFFLLHFLSDLLSPPPPSTL